MQADQQPIRLRQGNQGVTAWRLSCGAYIALVAVAFAQPLVRLVLYSASTELHSHIPLVPLISGYLLYIRRERLPGKRRPARIRAAALLASVFVVLLIRALCLTTLSANDELALLALAFVLAIVAGGFAFLGSAWMAAAAFPIGFLVFMIPMPDAVVSLLEAASMKASADVAAFFLSITDTPFVRDEQIFTLPGITLRVAEECSGIRSSWVLFITSWLASDLFLKSRWRGLLTILLVIPLGVIRNGFRILVIALMCVHIGPEMIDSVVHRHGGPLFFGLSLGPLLLLVGWLRWSER